MEYTVNYQLPTWVKEDRIMMDDFNDMTGKIDEAIFSRMGPMEIIKTVTLKQSTRPIAVDMTDFDWSQWSIIGMELRCNFTQTNNNYFTSLDLDGISIQGGACHVTPPGHCMALLFPGRNAQRAVFGFGFPGGGTAVSDSPYADISSIGFGLTSPADYPAGTKLTIWGIR